VQALGKGFRQPVSQHFQQDGAVVVIRLLENRHPFIDADPGGDGECTQIIRYTGLLRGDPIGQAIIGFTIRFRRLLAQVVQGQQNLLAALIGIQGNVAVAAAIGGEKADHRPRRQPAFGDDFIQHGVRLSE